MGPAPDEYVQSDPDATLERGFIAEYLELHGHTILSMHQLPAAEASALMKAASIYASARLSEMQSRAHYIHDIHDASKRSA
jgi:hypothetical protein